jgi:DMSO/TMAO reductase YedYZ molybdopterin-dependent catalytic subunit
MSFLAATVLSILALAGEPAPNTGARPLVLTVQVKSQKPVTLTAEQLGKLPRAKLRTGKDKDQRTYEGVPVAEVLHAAGIAWGGNCSSLVNCYVVVEGADHYRAVFSIPEIDPGLAHKAVLLADQCEGKPLSKTAGPYQTVEEDAKQHGRWVRQVTAIRVCEASR